MFCSTFAAMETAVRSGNSPYQSNIINYYIVAGLDRAKAMDDIEDTKRSVILISKKCCRYSVLFIVLKSLIGIKMSLM